MSSYSAMECRQPDAKIAGQAGGEQFNTASHNSKCKPCETIFKHVYFYFLESNTLYI